MPEGDHASQFAKYDVAARTESELQAQMLRHGQFDPGGDLTLKVSATDFRLRSGAAAFWVGGMAGSDFYNVEVQVLRGDELVHSFTTNTNTILGGIAYASPTVRSTRMIRSIAERVRAGL